MKTLNKAERRQADLKRHYEFLERFSEFLGNKQDGKKLSIKLLWIEREAHLTAEDYCNGRIGTDAWETDRAGYMAEVLAAFGVKKIPGFFINGDPRGYALKIDDDNVRDYYPSEIGFYRDMGGYGILSPEME